MSFTEQDLDNLSKLSRITISPEEKPKMLQDIQSILGYISEINEVTGEATRGEESFYNVVREDIITNNPGSHTPALLREAPETQGDYVKVKQVLKQ
jgi:aspartyl/glutamyl-tRNA(Asn/Gln) amidotransferase C subunit